MNKMDSMCDKNVLITGATSGLGLFMTVYLSKCCKYVYPVGRNAKALPKNIKNIEFIECDFEIPKSREIFYRKLNALHIDAVLHCLGGGFKMGNDFLDEGELFKLFNLNFFISAEINRIVIPKMKLNNRGWIIHVGSIASREVTASVGYTSVKAIIPAYVKSLGRKLIADGVFMTAIIPGGMRGYGGSMDRLDKINPNGLVNFISSRRPTKNLSNVDAYGSWVKMLMSEEARLHASNSIVLDEAESTAII